MEEYIQYLVKTKINHTFTKCPVDYLSVKCIFFMEDIFFSIIQLLYQTLHFLTMLSFYDFPVIIISYSIQTALR